MGETHAARRNSTPSPLSPVGPALQYAVDDENLDLSSILPHRSDPEGNDDFDSQSSISDEAPQSRLVFRGDLREGLLNSPFQQNKLNGLNYLNVVTYLINVFMSYGIGIWGLDGLVPTRLEISKEHQTLVTPPEWAYYIWIPILASELVFAVAQLSSHYRSRPIVQCGTGYFFFYTCLIQIAWTLCFAFELFVLSFVAVVAALIAMASLLANQHYTRIRGRLSRTEYWMFEFPFYMHFGWLIMCSVVQLSLLLHCHTSSTGIQLAADIVALGAMLPPATYFLLGKPHGPDFVVPLVIVFSYVAIGMSLNDPSEAMQAMHEHSAIVAIRTASFFFACTVGIMLVPSLVVWMTREFCTINVVELNEMSTGSVGYHPLASGLE